MSVEAVSALTTPALQFAAEPSIASTPGLSAVDPAGDDLSFDTLVSGIDALNDKLVAGTDAAHALALGQVDNLHQVMMSGTETRLAFDLMLQVRGKVLDAYQELLRMQV